MISQPKSKVRPEGLQSETCAHLINEAMQEQREARKLFEEGRISEDEAEHRIINATQIIVFAQLAMGCERQD